MAKAIKQERKVREVVEQEEQVVLTLTPQEAQLVADVLAMSAGCPRRSRRGMADTVRKALEEAGVRWQSDRANRYNPSDVDPASRLHFNDSILA